MYTTMMSFVKEMHQENTIEIGDFAPRNDVALIEEQKPPKAINYKIKKKEELIEILRRSGVYQIPIPRDGEGIEKRLLIQEIEANVKANTEELIDAGLATLKENVEPDTECLMAADEFLYSPTKPTEPPPGPGYSPKNKKIRVEDVALEAANAFRDKNNSIIHMPLGCLN
jgi:hypothetical protein